MLMSQEQYIKQKNAEYETHVHFQKCYNVMAEIFEHFGKAGE